MATIKLGAIISDIAGSVGGTTFRRGTSSIAMYNKPKRQFRSSLNPNSVKNKLGNIMSVWSREPKEVRADWEAQSQLFPFKDKFGNDKFLTGRQLYIKLRSQKMIIGDSAVNPNTLNGSISAVSISSTYSSLSSEQVYINYTEEIQEPYTCFKFIRRKNSACNYINKKVKIDKVVDIAGDSSTNIYVYLVEKFGTINAGETFTIVVFNLNDSGFVSAQAQTNITIEA